MKISDVGKKTGLSSSTIRYYEKLGIIRNIKKNENNIRIYNENDLRWISFLSGFKKTKIPLNEMIRYADLYYSGDSTIDDRMELLLSHREKLMEMIQDLNNALDFVDRKLNFYHNKKKDLNTDDHLSCL